MKIATMFYDVSVSLFRKPNTERYPFERREVPECLRGMLNWNPENCTGCGLCALDCPACAIEMMVLDKKAKKFVLTYHLDKCIFCGQCVYSCRQVCLTLEAGRWELAAFDRDQFHMHFGDEDGSHTLATNLSTKA